MSNSIDSYWNANKQYLVNAASSAGIDPGDMAKIAGLESHYNPTARPISSNSHKNTVTQFDGVKAMSSAYGLGQFTNATWTSVINEHGAKYGVKNAGHLTSAQANTPELRNDVQLQANMFAELTHDNMQRASGKGGSDIAANIYAMHNLGAGDGPVFLNAVKNNPKERVDSILSADVIKGNPSLYGDGTGTVADAYASMGRILDQYQSYADQAKNIPAQKQALHSQSQAPDEHHSVLKQGMRGEEIKHVQQELHDLGYLKAEPDGRFGPVTQAAVADFQRAQGLGAVDGKIGSETQQKLDAAVRDQRMSDFVVSSGAAAQLRDFSDPGHPQNALYNTLKEGFPPGTSPELLTQATAACYMSGIKQPDDLGHVIGSGGSILFQTNSMYADNAVLNTSQPAPSVQQTMQQVQQFDQHQAQISAQLQAQNAQINAQAALQGPVMGGPPTPGGR